MIFCSIVLILSISSLGSAFKRVFVKKSSVDFNYYEGLKYCKAFDHFVLDLQLFHLLFEKFSQKRICKFSLFSHLTLIKRVRLVISRHYYFLY